MQYLKFKNADLNDSNSANKKDIEGIIDEFTKTDISPVEFVNKIKNEFPLKDSTVSLPGSKEAIEIFNAIKNKKFDINLALENITNLDFKRIGQDPYELYFSVSANNQNINIPKVSTIYQASTSFLDQFMVLGKAAKFGLAANEKDSLLALITEYRTNNNINKKKAKLRFIEDDNGNTLLRAVVGENYKPYDNAVVLYIAFAIIIDLTKQLNKKFTVHQILVTDSRLYISFLQEDLITIDQNTQIQVGLRVRNSELGDGAARFEAIYRVQYQDNKKRKIFFTVVKDPISIIDHGYNPVMISRKLKKLHDFSNQVLDIEKAVKQISWNKKLTKDDLNIIANNISHLRKNMPKQLKNIIVQDIDATDVTNKTFTLIDLFSKLDDLVSKQNIEVKETFESHFAAWIRKLK